MAFPISLSRAVISGVYAGEDKENQSSSIGVFSLAPELAAADNDPDVSADVQPAAYRYLYGTNPPAATTPSLPSGLAIFLVRP